MDLKKVMFIISTERLRLSSGMYMHSSILCVLSVSIKTKIGVKGLKASEKRVNIPKSLFLCNTATLLEKQ